MLGFVDFADGDIFTAAHADGVLRQGIMSFATTAARDSALSTVLEDGLYADTRDTDTLWRYNGSAWKTINSPDVDYTITWTNLTVGNGTVVSKKGYVGGKLLLTGQITFGTTTSIAGTVQMTIPDSITATTAGAKGSGLANDSSASTLYGITVAVAPSDTQVLFAWTGVVNATVPFTWATGDVLSWEILIGV